MLRATTLAAAGLIVAGAAAGLALWGALALQPLPVPSLGAAAPERSVAARPAAYAAEQVLAAVDRDPFQPARHRPALGFRLPEELAVARRRPAGAGDISGAIRVSGTAVLPDGGGFAICQRSGGPSQLVRVGGTFGDLTLKAVTPGAATFLTASGATVVVRVVKPGGGS
jgi:hypothetical protein